MERLIEIALLGMLQGVTEFLPVSSSGHLALAGLLFGVEEAGLTLNVLLHAGTLLATCLVLRSRLGEAVRDGAAALLAPRRFQTTEGGRDAAFILLASLPTGVIGLSARDLVERWTHSPSALAVGFCITTALLVATRFAPQGRTESPGPWMALGAGVIQGMAVVPGISRSGATIALLLFLGVKRSRAFELSMLMSLPAVLGAVLLEVPELLDDASTVVWPLFGLSVAFATGVLSLVVLRRVVVGGRFWAFALWVGPVAVATLAMARAWP